MSKFENDRIETLLKEVADLYWKEDQATREMQIRKWRRLKLLWEGFTRTWYSEVAHDWRIYDPSATDDNGNEDYYDKPINVFRAYLESIIAALSVTIPAIKCYPDDADNTLDALTAKAGDKIAKLIYRHNDIALVWLQALFIYSTEGMVAAHSYSCESEEYGTVKEQKTEDYEERHEIQECANCGMQLADTVLSEAAENEFNPDDSDAPAQDFLQRDEQLCPECLTMGAPDVRQENMIVSRIVGTYDTPKARQKIEVYGGLYVKVANYARKQSETPYLFWSYELNYALARAKYPNIRECIQPGENNSIEPYERWARLNPQYMGQTPENTVTCREAWLRPEAFESLPQTDDVEFLRKKFPNGARVALVNTEIAEYENQSLDDVWTLTQNPMSDFLYFEPLGTMLTSVQEITNDLISLTLQTIEHGIPQTFADPAVLNFDGYSQQETAPGAIYPATPKSGKSMSDGFYEVRTSTLSPEVMPFGQSIQSLGQMAVGAQPSLFGGDMAGSKTASEYSMSRAQALQRLQNTWKMFTSWWKQIFGKVIPAYIKDIRDEEKYTDRDKAGNFISIAIHRAELEGKIGQIELEANENLPVTFAQQKDAIMQMLQSQNPVIQQILMDPDNIPLLYEALGINDLTIPGGDSRQKQYDEIKELLATEPIELPPEAPPPEELMQMEENVAAPPMMPPEPEASVQIGEFDNHQVELSICIKWLNSEEGRQAKYENPKGYQNVLLHAQAHKGAMMMEMMQQAMQAQQTAPPDDKGGSPKKPKETDKEAPITGDNDVSIN